MTISERINPDQLNIHQFQEVPEARSKAPFDPERDISPETRERILNEILANPKPDLIDAANFAIIWPEAGIFNHLSSDKMSDIVTPDSSGLHMLMYLPRLKVLFPDLDLKLDQDDWSKMKTLAADESPSKVFYSAQLKILDPAMSLVLSRNEMEVAQSEAERLKNLGDFAGFIRNLASLRLLDSDYYRGLTKDEWSKAFELLSEQEDHKGNYMIFAMYMKILAAHKVEITAPGVVEFQMYPPSDLNQSAPPMPETRKF